MERMDHTPSRGEADVEVEYQMSLKKILFRAVLVYVVGAIFLIGSGYVFAGMQMQREAALFGEAACLFVARMVVYFAIARHDATAGFKHLLLIVVAIEVFDGITVLVLGGSLSFLLEYWWSSALHLLAAMAGLGAARWGANHQPKPKPLRDSD
ncbi:hypothetical protein ACFW0P_16735 [Lysobacter soli]|uniref:hypothetical protein n=1 Tax=Lysobacter soli TaxID=453783 RepID=UPI003679F366